MTDAIKGTFGGGLEAPAPAASTRVTLDFNYAYNPSCAYDSRWACPLAPPENRLEQPIRAGELRSRRGLTSALSRRVWRLGSPPRHGTGSGKP